MYTCLSGFIDSCESVEEAGGRSDSSSHIGEGFLSALDFALDVVTVVVSVYIPHEPLTGESFMQDSPAVVRP